METKTHTFVKGMNTDTGYSLLDGTSYLYAENLELSSSKDGDIGSLVNVSGNSPLPSPLNPQDLEHSNIVGYTEMRDSIIIFEANRGHNNIWKYKPGTGITRIIGDEDLQSGESLGFYQGMIADPNYRVTAVASYESETSQKIYWSDGVNPLRYLNIAQEVLPSRLQDLNIIPIGTYKSPKNVEIVPGGAIKVGKVQYSYRLVNKYGSVSSYSSASPLLSITGKEPTSSSSYYGTDRDTSSNKSVRVTIAPVDDSFDIIQLFAIHYSEIHSTPVINLVAEIANPKDSNDIILTDSGKVISEYTMVEYNAGGGRLFSANALEAKDGILFAGGINELQSNDYIDCRAYSFSKLIEYNGNTITSTSNRSIGSEIINYRTGDTQQPVIPLYDKVIDNIKIEHNNIILVEGTSSINGSVNVIVACHPSDDELGNPDLPITVDTDYNVRVKLNNTTIGTLSLTIHGSNGDSVTSSSFSFSHNLTEMSGHDTDKLSFEWDRLSVTGTNYPVFSITLSSITLNSVMSNVTFDSKSVLYKADGSIEHTILNLNTNSQEWDIPITNDCINSYNDVYKYNEKEYRNSPLAFKYQSDGNTLGGTGKIVSYKFVDYHVSPQELEHFTTEDISDNKYILSRNRQTTSLNQNKEYIINTVTGFKRGEVYRCGIEFFDLLGKPMFVNWIADIRIPYTFEYQEIPNSRYVTSKVIGTKEVLIASPIKIEFSVNTNNIPSGFKAKISGYKIVAVPREIQDRTVLMQGYCKTAMYSNNDGIYMPLFGPSSVAGDYTSNLLDFHSPDYFANRATPSLSKSKAVIISRMGKNISGTHTLNLSTGNKVTRLHLFDRNYPRTDDPLEVLQEPIFRSMDIVDWAKLNYNDSKGSYGYTITLRNNNGSETLVNYKNRPHVGSALVEFSDTSIGPTSLLLSVDNQIELFGSFIVDIVTDNCNSRYGGNSFYSRQRNTYYGISKFININSNSHNIVTTGDTYTTMYSQMLAYAVSGEDETRRQSAVVFPVESSINCLMFKSKPVELLQSAGNVNLSKWGIQETQADGITMFPNEYPNKLGDLFEYNSVFSQQPVFPTYHPKPFLFDEESKNDTMIIASEKKIGKELEDPWTKFLYANLIELPNINGTIRELKSIESKLICWQDDAVSNISTNDRYLINEGNAGQLALGTGGILERYDVISDTTGAQSLYTVAVHDNAIYWLDSKRNSIMSYDSQVNNLGVVKGINKFLKDKGAFSFASIGINRKKNKVYFRIKDNVVLSYNLELQVFEGVITSPTKWFIPLKDTTLLESNGNLELHVNDSNNRCVYYGISHDSLIEFVSSDKYLYTKSFDTLEWSSESSSITNTNIPPSVAGINKIQVYNDYQNTGDVNITPRKSERSYRIDIPRDSINSNETTPKNINDPGAINQSALFRRRILGKYAVIRLYHDNNGDYKIVIPYVNVNYRISYR